MTLTHSISCCHQMSGKKNLRKERFILAYGSRGIIPLWQGRQDAKSRQMAHQTASIPTKQRMNRKWAWLSDFKPHLLKPMFFGESPLLSGSMTDLSRQHSPLETMCSNSQVYRDISYSNHSICFSATGVVIQAETYAIEPWADYYFHGP